MIHKAAGIICRKYAVQNGYHADAKIIYGDTDSLMVDFHLGIPEEDPKAVERAMALGREAADLVTAHMPSPMVLEFEKVWCV